MENITEQFDKAFENIPEEVRDFIASELFTQKVEKIATVCFLSEDQKSTLSGVIVGLLNDVMSIVQSQGLIKEFGLSDDQFQKIVDFIDEEFIVYAQEIVIKNAKRALLSKDIEDGVLDYDDDEVIVSTENPIADQISINPLSSIANKMQTASVVAPIASVAQKYVPGPQNKPIQDTTTPTKSTDPYREMPL